MRTRMLVSGLVVACLSLGVLAIHSHAEEAESIDLDAIIRQITLRQKSVKTIDYAWTSQEVQSKGSRGGFDPDGNWLPSAGPDEDTEIQSSVRLVIDGQKIRTDKIGQVWNFGLWRFEPDQWSWCFAEGKSVDYHALLKSGVVSAAADRRHSTNLHFEALICAYRLFDPLLGIVSPDEVSVSGRAEHDGHPCIVIERVSQDSGIVRSWFLAEDQGYCPVRYQSIRGSGELIRDITMRYERDDDVGWRLTSWGLSHRGQFVKVDAPMIVINEAVDPELFELEFPPGTSVYDEIVGVSYTVGGESKEMAILKEMGILQDLVSEGSMDASSASGESEDVVRPQDSGDTSTVSTSPQPTITGTAARSDGGSFPWHVAALVALVIALAIGVGLAVSRLRARGPGNRRS